MNRFNAMEYTCYGLSQKVRNRTEPQLSHLANTSVSCHQGKLLPYYIYFLYNYFLTLRWPLEQVWSSHVSYSCSFRHWVEPKYSSWRDQTSMICRRSAAKEKENKSKRPIQRELIFLKSVLIYSMFYRSELLYIFFIFYDKPIGLW